MVWHAYQLNPRDFLEDCLRYGKMKFWRTGLPWAAIDSCIDNDTFEFIPTAKAVRCFAKRSNCSWNSLDDLSEAQVKCPKCKKVHPVPWTEWSSKSAWVVAKYEATERLDGEILGHGFADRNFSFASPCGFTIDHETLRTQKFRKDIEALQYEDVPMPGTLLTLDGL